MDEGLEVSAKTVDEAVEQALAQLGLSRTDVEIEVIDPGGRGRFGLGNDPARVRVRPIEDEDEDDDQEGEIEGAGLGADEEGDVERGYEDDEDSDVQGGGRPTAAASADSIGEAADILRNLLRFLDIPASVSVREPQTPADGLGQATAVLDINGDDVGLLIGRRGATLAALQYMVNLLINRGREGKVTFTVDIEGYRRRRERTLMQMAQRAADRVRSTGDSVEMEPMPANERRIVHLMLQEDRDVSTQSTGGGEQRRIVVSPREQ